MDGVDPRPARAQRAGGMGEAVDVVQGKPTNQPGHTIFSDPEFPAKLSQHLPSVWVAGRTRIPASDAGRTREGLLGGVCGPVPRAPRPAGSSPHPAGWAARGTTCNRDEASWALGWHGRGNNWGLLLQQVVVGRCCLQRSHARSVFVPEQPPLRSYSRYVPTTVPTLQFPHFNPR